MLIKYPAGLTKKGQVMDVPMTLTDVMPTLLSLTGQSIPATVEGRDYAPLLRNPRAPRPDDAALIACVVPFHQWNYDRGGREYRGLHTSRYTYVRDLKGPWLLYDNTTDPNQLTNLVNTPKLAQTQRQLNDLLTRRLRETNDSFSPGNVYMDKWRYPWATIDSVGNPHYK